ncbi:unnamed protein product [Owenia fusiformis]|uniref:Uncharacterized protein n=1 Tax=Owenia fusiformis TaxID=6347 RepID=A0A8J1TUF3_OWEFU|nr:unnamed protein product [Owenia fusiformis]
MDFKDTRLYKTLTGTDVAEISTVMHELIKTGRDITLQDPITGRGYLHVIAEHSDRFKDARAIPVVYQLTYAGIDINLQDINGDTALHIVVKNTGAHAIMVALIRSGADMGILNKKGESPLDCIKHYQPLGHGEMEMWHNAYKPGLYDAVMGANPDAELVERLLKSWCRVIIFRNKEWINLAELVQPRTGNTEISNLLKKYQWTNQYVHATLGGSVYHMKYLLAKDTGPKIDVKTFDVSHFTPFPECLPMPRPLLASSWEQLNFDIIEELMTSGANTSVLYGTAEPGENSKKPLIFHLAIGPNKPSLRIIHRILKQSKMNCKNPMGETLIYECIRRGESKGMIQSLINYGTDISLRNVDGQTARDAAEEHSKPEYVELIDKHVGDTVIKGDMNALKKLAIQGYDHLEDIGRDADVTYAICSKIWRDDMYAFFRNIPKIEAKCEDLFTAVDTCDLDKIKKLSDDIDYENARDACGMSLLHRALLQNDIPHRLVEIIIERFPHTVQSVDNMMRTPLHFAYLLHGDSEIIDVLLNNGASNNSIDVNGLTATDYKSSNCSTLQWKRLQRNVLDFQLHVKLKQMKVHDNFKRAIQENDMKRITSMVEELKIVSGNSVKPNLMSVYSTMLFYCVDEKKEHIARYLLKNGADPDIYQTNADKTTSCGQPCVISLLEKATSTGMASLRDDIIQIRNKKRTEGRGTDDKCLDVFMNFGGV